MKQIVNFGKRAFAVFAISAAAAVVLTAQTFSTLFSFNERDGAAPVAGLFQGADGDFYGTTSTGGAHGSEDFGGTVFKITSGGALTTLHDFCAQPNCADGELPLGLVQAINGDLYGTTENGGSAGAGTVFKITPDGALTTVYDFCTQSGCPDGKYPNAGLVQIANGDLYGTTVGGGAYGSGTIFEIAPDGSFSTLYSFCAQSDCTDGAYPYAGLIQATDGDLYGTTQSGGSYDTGTVFKMTPGGTLTTLYTFCNSSSCGQNPIAGLVQASDGNLFGTTLLGGAFDAGTVFRITPTGAGTILYSFFCSRAACENGSTPKAGLIQASDGNLYGTTDGGGYSDGTIFRITLGGTLTTLHSFCGQSRCADGSNPVAGLVEGTDGTLYGTAEEGGVYGYGVVYSLSLGLGPFVESRPGAARVGEQVLILGTSLAGATSVTFNGTPAEPFTVNSTGSAIRTAVPPGATTGMLQVVTPGGTLLSNKPFVVFP